METLNSLNIEGEEENISEENSEEELDYKWKLNYETEKLFWIKTVLPELIYNPTLCPKCKKDTYRVYEKKKSDLINPFYLKCIIQSCQKRENIRNYSILKCAKTIPASIIVNIIKYFIIEKKNATEIEKSLKESYQCVPNYSTILKILNNVRYFIAEYLKYAYKLVQIGGDPDSNRTVAIDETLITHIDTKQVWIVGAIDTTTKNVRLDVIPESNGHMGLMNFKAHCGAAARIHEDALLFGNGQADIGRHYIRQHDIVRRFFLQQADGIFKMKMQYLCGDPDFSSLGERIAA